jgi:hypothetical protein
MGVLVQEPARGRGFPRLPNASWRDAGLAALVVASGIGTYLLARTALVDDAYITLSYARNVALHGTWGLLSDVPSNAATSPVWVLLLAATTVVVRDTVVALGVLHVLMLVAAVFSLRAAARRTGLPSWVAPVGVLLVAVNPLVMSTMGLETEFLITLFTCLLAAGTAHRPALFGLLAGLVFLTRMDTVFALVLFTLFFPAIVRRLHVMVGVTLVVVLPWLWWSWHHLGSVLPDTLLIKSGQKSWGHYDVSNGWGFWLRFDHPLVVFTAWVPMAAGAIAVLGLVVLAVRTAGPRLLPWIAVAVAGAAHWRTLVVIGVPPYHWYFGSVIAAGTLTVVALCGALAGTSTGRAWLRAVVASVCAVPLVLSVYVDVAQPAKSSVEPSDRASLPWEVAPIQSNWMTSAAYENMGADLRRLLTAPDGTVQRVAAFGEIGHLAYVCDCVVDGFADPALLEPTVAELQERSSPWLRGLLEVDHRYRDVHQRPVPLVGRLVYMHGKQTPPAGAPSWRVDLNPAGGHIVLLYD